MKQRIYVETSVISYLAAKPSKEPVNAARQLQAKAFWLARQNYQLLISAVVIDEARQGNAAKALARQAYLSEMQILSATDEAAYLAQLLIDRKALPAKALADASHIAIAAVHHVKVVASYNFRHLAGVFARAKIENCLRQLGYEPPLIATPEEILGAPS